jgi:hypothetical protein
MALNGTWTNELGSVLILNDDGNGMLSGTYSTAVGGPAGEAMDLTGSYDKNSPAPIPLGWSVAWTGWGSTTSWCGLLFDDGTLTATWILASTIPADEGWWQSMNVGMDNFTRDGEVDKKTAQKRLRSHGASHPMRKRG